MRSSTPCACASAKPDWSVWSRRWSSSFTITPDAPARNTAEALAPLRSAAEPSSSLLTRCRSCSNCRSVASNSSSMSRTPPRAARVPPPAAPPAPPTPPAPPPRPPRRRRRLRRAVLPPHVRRAAVQPAQQVPQVSAEALVAARAPQPARPPEVAQRRPAEPARDVEPALALLRAAPLAERREEVAQREFRHTRARFHALLRRARLAQMHRRHVVVDDLGEVDDRLALAAVLAHHQGSASTSPTYVSRPSSSSSARSARAASWRLCVTINTAVSSSRARRKNRSATSTPAAWSRLPVGSSASTRSGSCTSARATAQRCCSPPESAAGR